MIAFMLGNSLSFSLIVYVLYVDGLKRGSLIIMSLSNVGLLPYVIVIVAGMNLLFGVPILAFRSVGFLVKAQPSLKVWRRRGEEKIWMMDWLTTWLFRLPLMMKQLCLCMDCRLELRLL